MQKSSSYSKSVRHPPQIKQEAELQNYSSIYEQLLTKLSLTKEYSKLFDSAQEMAEEEQAECWSTFRPSTTKPNERYSRSFAKDDHHLSSHKAQDVQPEARISKDATMTLDVSMEDDIFEKRSKSSTEAG